MTSASVTRRNLNVALRTYAETTIKGVIQPQGTNLNGLSIGNYAKYAHTFFTADVIYEGDQIEDANHDVYEVLNVQAYWWLDAFSHYVCELLKTVDATLKVLTLGAQDAVTGLYALSYSAGSTITMNLAPKGQSMIQTALGYHSKYEMSGVTSAIVCEGDRVEDASGVTYEIKQVAYYPTKRSTAFSYAVCALELLPTEGLTSTAYTASTVDDPRYRTKVWLDTYLTAASLPAFITAYDNPKYPITRVFIGKAIDVVYSIGEPVSTAIYQSDKSIYGYEENVPVTICAIDKNVKGTVLNWQAETELRKICEDHPFGVNSIRVAGVRRGKTERVGSFVVYSTELTLIYRRDKA